MPLAGLFVTAATTALSIAIVVSITGGFTIDAGPLHLSAHRVVPPLAVAVTICILAAWFNRARFVSAAAAIAARLHTHAAAVAVVCAALTAALGVAFGTYAASGADAGGYISQARLLAHGDVAFHEPLVQQVAWPDAAWTFAPLGFRPGVERTEIVPTYPPGLPLTMWLASALAGEVGPFLIAPLLGAIGVIATYCLAARVHSRTSGAIAAAFLATSPVWLFQIVQPMSDVPAAALWTLALLAAVSGRATFSGLTAAVALMIRPNLFPLAAAAAFILFAWPHDSLRPFSIRSRARPVVTFVVTASLGIAAVAAMQWRLYGNPLASGHGSFSELFAASNILTNVRDYSVRVLNGETPALIVAAASLVVLVATRRIASPATSVSNAVRLLLVTAAAVLICYLPYGVFPDWSYLRFLLPAFPVAFIAIGALATNAAERMPPPIRGIVIVLAVVAVCSANVMIARREAVFDLWRYESRYRTAGRYLAAVLPRDAVIVTAQESASAHFYTGLPILRWDLLPADLDAALAALNGLGRHPVLLIEDWEEPTLRTRFPESQVARLDWRSRAVFGTTTRVRYLDPDDRDDSSAPARRSQGLQDHVP